MHIGNKKKLSNEHAQKLSDWPVKESNFWSQQVKGNKDMLIDTKEH